MKTLIIKSNHGNHTGFNRNYRIVEEFEYHQDNVNTASCKLADIHNELNDLSEGDFDFETNITSFEYDLCYYYVVTQEDFDNNFFDGGHRGYASNEIKNFFGANEEE